MLNQVKSAYHFSGLFTNSFISSFNGLAPIRHWLNRVEIHNPTLAHLICHIIPAQCPFARDIWLLGWSIHIPPLCKLNPFYEEVISLRFRALCYLAEECHTDIRRYC